VLLRRHALGLIFGSSVIAACATGTGARPRPASPGGPLPAASALPIEAEAAASDALAVTKRRRTGRAIDCASVKPAPTTCSLWDKRQDQDEFDSPELTAAQDAAGETLEDLMTWIACTPDPSASNAPKAASTRWDRRTPPSRLDLVERRFGVTADERRHLFADGVVVSSRLEYPDYGAALQEVHRSQLPLYFSVDALFHAIYIGHDRYLAEVESTILATKLGDVLTKIHARLETNKNRYWTDTLNDLDIYLTVAEKLLEDSDLVTPGASSIHGNDKAVERLVGVVERAGGLERMDMFGRSRMVDTAQFRPRGHYASAAASKNPFGADLSHYFRAAMWLSRIELNLVSRSSQSSAPVKDTTETPREATMAMALAELIRDAGVLDDVKGIDQAWEILAGHREDVSAMNLLDLMKQGKIEDGLARDAPEKLRAAIGTGFARTARTHFVPQQGGPDLPVIATMLGPRITNDAQATRPIVHPIVPGRTQLPAVEMTYLLGHDRALDHLRPALTAFPGLRAQLDVAREVTAGTKTVDGVPRAPQPTTDLYSGWFAAIRGLAETPRGSRPAFMETDAYKDMRVSSAVAAYGQIRHNYVLIVPETYEEGGCEIPDAYVEPAPAVYAALIDYAKRGQRAVRALEGADAEGRDDYFVRLENVLRVLSRIGDRELRGEPLRDEEKRFLAMVAEDTHYRRAGYGPSSPLYNGWYYELFPYASQAHDSAQMVADYFASVQQGTTEYAGVAAVRMGFFVVDTNGTPRMAVGPVARSFQAEGPFAPRFSDDEVNRMSVQEPWAATYTAKAATTTPFVIRPASAESPNEHFFDVTARGDVGQVTLSFLDHHRQPIASQTKVVKGTPDRPAKVRFVLKTPALTKEQQAFGIEGLGVSAGTDFHWVAEDEPSFLSDVTARWEMGPTNGKRIGGYEGGISTNTRGKRGRF
jgi:Protein of unknown function (DUF3160)